MKRSTARKTVLFPPGAAETPSIPPCPSGYRLLEKIGSGGMGEVWKARDLELGRYVAIKFLRAIASEDDLARFKREAETASRLNHPGVTTIYAVGQEQGRSYIVMRLVNGRTLGMWPDEDPRGLVRIVRDAALIVDHAHAHGVLHRDIKPANILLEESDDPHRKERTVLVTDFGLAKWIVDASPLTQTGQAVGTPAYMPPEQVLGGETGRRGDVYSLGATLYEMIAGRPPYSGENALQILRKVVDEDPPPLEGELGAVVAKAMERNPQRRYATALEFAEDLDRWLDRQRVRAPRAGFLFRLRRRVERRKKLAIGLAAGLALAVLLRLASPGEEEAPPSDAVSARVNELLLAWVTGRAGREALAEQVIRDVERSARRDPRPATWVWLGRCLRLLGRDAAPCWDEALRIAPYFRDALLERDRDRLVAEGRSRGPDFCRKAEESTAASDGPLRSGVHALRRGDGPAAEAAFTGVLEAVPWDGLAFALRSQARRMQGRYADAEADGSRAVELLPRDPWVVFLRGAVFHDQLRFSAAERDFTRALELDPAWAPAHAARGALYADQRLAEKAESDLRRALELNPRDPRSLARLGDALVEQQRWTEAEATYTKAVRLDPGFAAAWRARARLFLARRQPAAAEEDFGKALSADPAHAKTWEERGNLRRDAGRHAEALEDWKKAIELDARLRPALAPRLEASTRALPR